MALQLTPEDEITLPDWIGATSLSLAEIGAVECLACMSSPERLNSADRRGGPKAMNPETTTSAPKVGSSAMVRRKCAAIYGPIPGTDGTKWVCLAVDGNLRWKTAAECDSEEDAKRWAKRTRDHWRKFSDMQVCTRLSPNNPDH